MPPVVLPAFCADRERPRLTCVLPSSQPASDSNRESRSRACRTSATECNAGRPRCECSSLPSFPSFVLLPGPSKKQRTGDIRRHHRRRCECRCCGCAGRDPAQGPADAAAAAAAEREGRGDPEALSFPSSLLSFSPFLLSFPSLLSLSPSFPSLLLLSFPSLPLLARNGPAGMPAGDWHCSQWGEGGRERGAFVGYVGVGGAGGNSSPAQKAQSSNKRDRGTAAAHAAGSWQLAKKFWYQYNSQYWSLVQLAQIWMPATSPPPARRGGGGRGLSAHLAPPELDRSPI